MSPSALVNGVSVYFIMTEGRNHEGEVDSWNCGLSIREKAEGISTEEQKVI